jgi:WD40 repeat protein/serine/threonine protein kinase
MNHPNQPPDNTNKPGESPPENLHPDPADAPTMLPSAGSFAAEDATLPQSEIAQATVAGASAMPSVKYFGDYELLSEIARGGMGVVYKARQVNLNRLVALKMILAGQFASDEDVKRFYTEAEAAAALEHPGIVPIFEIGQQNDQHFFSMGFVDGGSLADKLKDGPLPSKEAASYTKKVAEAIAYAHSKGVIHRDLKPANILLDRKREPKVTDFGLARRTESNSDLTRTGAVMGTPSYMPPEQAAGRTDQVGPLADVYSLGAILYCLLTGRPPFQASNPLDTLMQVMEREPVSVTTLNPATHRDLETICHKCLQKDPAKRYASAQELADDLGRWLSGEPIRARAVSSTERAWRWVKRNPILSGSIASTVVAILLGSVASLWFAIDANRARLVIESAELSARTEAENARSALEKTESVLARSHFFLANARWKEGRVGEARTMLQKVPPKYRNFEWYYSLLEFEGSNFTFYGHRAEVDSLDFSQDGSRIISAARDKTVKLWDAATGEELKTLVEFSEEVRSIAFSPDGSRIASGHEDNTVKIWNAENGQLLTTLEGHSDSVFGVEFSPDGTRVASASSDETIRLWDAVSGKELKKLNGADKYGSDITFSPDGTRIVAAGIFLAAWDLTADTEPRDLGGFGDRPLSKVSFNPDGTRIVCHEQWQGSHPVFYIRDAETGAILVTFKGHSGGTNEVAFSPDGMQVISSGEDGTLKLWDAYTGAELKTLAGHTGTVECFAFSPDGTQVATGGDDHTIKLWDIASGEERKILINKNIYCFALNAEGTRIVSDGQNVLTLWDAVSGEKIRTFKGHGDGSEFSVRSLAFSPDGTKFVSGSSDKTLKLWDIVTGEELQTLNGHTQGVSSIAFSPDGSRIVSGSGDGTLRIWDASSGEELQTLNGHTQWVGSVAFSPDGSRIVSGSRDNTLRIWDAASGEELQTLSGHSKDISGVAFSPDGSRIVSSSSDKTLKLWDAASGEELLTLTNNQEYACDPVFSPDGMRIFCGGGALRVWERAPGEEMKILAGHKYFVTGIAFSTDGNPILSRDAIGEQIVWNAQTGEKLTDAEDVSYNSSPGHAIDGSPLAIPIDNDIGLVDRQYAKSPREQARRKRSARLKPDWHYDQARAAEGREDWYAATFHWTWAIKGNFDQYSSFSARQRLGYTKLKEKTPFLAKQFEMLIPSE